MTDTIKVPRELLEYAVHKMGFVWPNTQNFKELQALLQAPAQPAQVHGWQEEILVELRKVLGTDGTVYRNVKAMLAAAPKPPVQESSPTAVMNLGERIAHIGGRTNEAGYIEFGSVQAVHALIQQVLRDYPTAAPQPSDDAKDVLLSVLTDIANTDLSGADDSVVRFIFIALQYRAKAAIDAAIGGGE